MTHHLAIPTRTCNSTNTSPIAPNEPQFVWELPSLSLPLVYLPNRLYHSKCLPQELPSSPTPCTAISPNVSGHHHQRGMLLSVLTVIFVLPSRRIRQGRSYRCWRVCPDLPVRPSPALTPTIDSSSIAHRDLESQRPSQLKS